MRNLAGVLISTAIAALLPVSGVKAQNAADSLRLEYDFAGAIELCEQLISQTTDSLELELLDSSLVLAQNGLSMTDYCYEPYVVAKVCLPVSDFFLYYPMVNGSWHPVPNQLDPSGPSDLVSALFYPENEEELFFSAPDSLGFRNVYETHMLDSLWSYPSTIFGTITSGSNEIYPMLSPDGRTLYFASDGLYGIGGYDLYVSSWVQESQSWSMPENLGFPFSSPYDDFLYFNTPDGKYTIFTSNRETTRDSVYVYVLDYDSTPVRKKVEDKDALRQLASLNPKSSSRVDNTSALSSSVVDDSAILRYAQQVDLVKALRDSLYKLHESINVPEMQARLNDAVKTLQRLELDFLTSGQGFDLSSLQKESQRDVVGADSGYTFSKNEPGGDFFLAFTEPEPEEEEPEEDSPKPRSNTRRAKNAQPTEVTRYKLVINPEDGRALPSPAIAAIRQETSKDIIRHSEEGTVTFEVGLFEQRSEVESIIELLKENGATNCTIEEEIIKLEQL